jgi:hypothetical protein
MPNWVFNSLVVSGEKSELDKLVNHLNQPVTKHFPKMEFDKEQQKWIDTPDVQVYNNPVFSFWNVISPSDLEAYYGEEVFKNRHSEGKTINEAFDSNDFMQEFHRAMSFDNDWYHWNVRNWGTKWDICVADDEEYPDTTMEWTDNGDVMYHFQTAWSPVTEVVSHLSMEFPTLEFDYEFEEEQGWGAKVMYIKGQEAVIEEWDIPDSHADHKKRDKECACEYGDIEYAYSDCPLTDTHTWDEEAGEWEEKEMSDPSAMINSSN